MSSARFCKWSEMWLTKPKVLTGEFAPSLYGRSSYWLRFGILNMHKWTFFSKTNNRNPQLYAKEGSGAFWEKVTSLPRIHFYNYRRKSFIMIECILKHWISPHKPNKQLGTTHLYKPPTPIFFFSLPTLGKTFSIKPLLELTLDWRSFTSPNY